MESFESFKKLVIKLWDSGEFESRNAIAEYLYETEGIFHYSNKESMSRAVRSVINKQEDKTSDNIYVENVKLKATIQNLRDNRRIQNKQLRNYFRLNDASKKYLSGINEQLKRYGKQLKTNIEPIKIIPNWETGVIHITDLHGNELVDLPHNQYNFDVLSRRTKKYISECLSYFEYKGVKRVVFVLGGDLLNSDRRADEVANQATNRSKASVLTAYVLSQAVKEVAVHYPVEVVSVMGNESRVDNEMSFAKEAISHNYDYVITSMMKMMLTHDKNIKFMSFDSMEVVVDIADQKWLISHDVNRKTDSQPKTQSTTGRYSHQGMAIDFIIGGHIHSFRGTDLSCRSGSFVGANEYSDNSLNLAGRASGVCYVAKGKERAYQYIDLQEYDNEGYDIIKGMEAYNVKSKGKCMERFKYVKLSN